VPAQFQQGGIRHAGAIAENTTGSYVSADPASTLSEIHKGNSSTDRSRQASGGNLYHYSQLVVPEQPALHPGHGFSYHSNTQGPQQTLVAVVLNIGRS